MALPEQLLNSRVDLPKLGRRLRKLAARAPDQTEVRLLSEALDDLLRAGIPTLVPLLPVLFSLKGRPFTLEHHFPFEPFFNTHMPRRTVVKTGRQVGKCCVCSDTPRLWLANGEIVGTSTVQVGQHVLCYDNQFRRTSARVVNRYDTGRQPAYRVRTQSGAVLECAATHQLRTPVGYIPLSGLGPGSRVLGVRLGGLFAYRNRIKATLVDIWTGMSSNDEFPSEVFQLSQKSTALLLTYLWEETDAEASEDDALYWLANAVQAQQIRSLLAKFAIQTRIERSQRSGQSGYLVRAASLADSSRFHLYFVSESRPGIHDWPPFDTDEPATFWDTIRSIRSLGELPTVDFEIDTVHNYVLGGICTHNSTAQAAQGVAQANCIPFFNTLFVTPLFEMIRRFSGNYVREFIEQSPLRKLWTSSKTSSNVLQRSFSNHSKMFFSFAFLNADRSRGINSDKVCLDETAYLLTPLTLTSNGQLVTKPIYQVVPGDFVLSGTPHCNPTWDLVTSSRSHGVRQCFRFTTQAGRQIVMTPESWIATTGGWKRVSQIIHAARQNYDRLGTPANPGDTAGRRVHEFFHEISQLPLATQLEAARVQLGKEPDIIQVRTYATQEAEEHGLREVVQSFQHPFRSGIFLLQGPVLPTERQKVLEREIALLEARKPSLAGSDHLGGDCLVGGGRREPGWPGAQSTSTAAHRGLYESGSPITAAVAADDHEIAYELAQNPLTIQTGENVLHAHAHNPINAAVVSQNQEIPAGEHALQDPLYAPGYSNLCILQPGVRRAGFQNRSQEPGLAGQTLLPVGGVLEIAAAGKQPGLHADTPRRAQRKEQTALLVGDRQVASLLSGTGSGVASAEPGTSTGNQAKSTSQTASCEETHKNLLQPLPNGPDSQREVLSGVSRNRNARNQAAAPTKDHPGATSSTLGGNRHLSGLWQDRAHESRDGQENSAVLAEMPLPAQQPASPAEISISQSQLVPDEIVMIEDVGRQPVWDIETDNNHRYLANGLLVHNCQDLFEEHVPILEETMSGSPYGGISQFTGTPKTLDNTMEKFWLRSSQGEWCITCTHCRKLNIPSVAYDLDEMIGPWREDISEEAPGIVCARCKKPIFPDQGQWQHAHPEKLSEFKGLHIPQIIMPMHYASPEKWGVLLAKRRTMSAAVFYNEVCGESFDMGAKLVTLTDIKAAACLPHENKAEQAAPLVKKYELVILSADWGGGGVKGESYTVFAVLGILSDGTIDVLYGYRSLTPHDQMREAELAMTIAAKFSCRFIVHDFCGAGEMREQFVINAGYPIDRIIPIWYVAAAKQGIMRYVEASELLPRDHWKVDKARSLLLTVHQMKLGKLRFFKYDYNGEEDPGLLHDFLALVEEKAESKRGRDMYSIIRAQGATDDFAQAVNMGCCVLWQITQTWPDLAVLSQYRMSESLLSQLEPDYVDWDSAG